MQTANTIAAQIGQHSLFMMGAKNLIGSENALSFKISGSTFTHIRVELTPMDTYNVTFYKIRNVTIKNEVTVSGVYVDNLKAVISETTKLYLSI
jgi:hypothetical protein